MLPVMRPVPLRVLKRLLLASACALAVPAGADDTAAAPATQADPRPTLALMGTIPIYWGETDGLESLLAGAGEAHWARARLERHWRLQPFDHLDAAALSQVSLLLLAQPRALSGAENVALDAWVRAGGRLLLFADPMMTGESRFGIGDRRRPQDVILLSPILGHWGLDLQFDENQPTELDSREFAGLALPVRLPGRFAAPATGSGCTLEAAEILVSCTIGMGRVVVLADAAVLDLHHPQAQAGDALDKLAMRAFSRTGETAGIASPVAENFAFQPVVASRTSDLPVNPASRERRASD